MKKFILLSLPVIIFFFIAEMVCRVISPKNSVFWDNPMMLQYPVQGFDESVTREKLNSNNDPNRAVRYVTDELRWYRLDPEPLIPRGKKLILHFGDSSTWGWGLPDRSYAYPDALNQILPDSVCSVNLGVPGYSSLQGEKYLESVMALYHEQILAITIYFGNNDCVENGGSDEKKLESAKSNNFLLTVSGWLEKNSAVYRVMRKGTAGLGQNDNTAPRVSPERYHDNLQKMIRLCKKYDIKVVIIHPTVHRSWKPGHLTWSRSLESEVKNPWVMKELASSDTLYRQGLKLLYQNNDSCENYFDEAIEHDWVMSRIKKPWLQKIINIANEDKTISVIKIVANNPVTDTYCFEDYCHPTAVIHQKIAVDIAKKLHIESQNRRSL